MFLLRANQFICIISLVCIASSLVEAKDINTLQTALTLAREDMEKAKYKHESNAQAVTQQQQIIAERKKQLTDEIRQLDQMQKDMKQAWRQYLEAKQKYEKTQSTFNSAWGKK